MAAKFGLSQIKNPTPTWAGTAVEIIYTVSSAVSVWAATAPAWIVGTRASLTIVSICGLFSLICGGLKKFVGVVTPQAEVPIENVTEMSEPKKD